MAAYLAESDIALAIPAIAAGLTVPVLGLVRTGEIYGLVVIGLALVATALGAAARVKLQHR